MAIAAQHDLEFTFEAQEILTALGGRLPTWAELEAINEEQGYGVALAVLYRGILQSQPHSSFIRHVQTAKPGFHDHKVGKSPVEVVIVPSVMPGPSGLWGAHVDWIRNIAREMGFTTDVVETSRKDSVAGNAWRIADHLKTSTASRIVMITTGRGSAEMRMYLQRKGKTAPEAKKVRGWLNINGCVHGSLLIESRLQKPFAKRTLQLKSMISGGKEAASLAELASSFPMWREQLATHQKLMIVSAFGLTMPNQLPLAGKDAFDYLATKGPNDGTLLAREQIIRPGLLYPIRGSRNILDEAFLQGHLQRLLTVIGASIVRDDQAAKPACPVTQIKTPASAGVEFNY
jgi:hypothetical protein